MTMPPDYAPPNCAMVPIFRAERMARFRQRRGFAWGLAAGLLVGMAAGAAFGQTPCMALDPGTGHCFAVVVIENRLGAYHRDETLTTERGDVVLHYETVRGHQPGDDDVITVLSLPDGVAASPMILDLPDGETGRICLLTWEGM